MTKTGEKYDSTFSDVRVMFDAIIDKYPDSNDKFTVNADIFNCQDSESAVAKLQGEN